MDEIRVPIYLITGFLESGKTTFLRFTSGSGLFPDRWKNTSHTDGRGRRGIRYKSPCEK